MTCAFVVSCGLAVSGSDPTGDAPAVVLRSYDLRSVVPALPNRAPLLSMLPYAQTNSPELPALEVDVPDASAVADAIMNLLGSEFEYEGRGLHVEENNRLVVAAPRDVQDKVQSALTAFEAAFSAGIDVNVDVLAVKPDVDLARLVPSAVIAAAEADRLLADLKGGADRASSHRLRLQPGRASVLDLTRRIAFLRDYDIEIAKSAAIADPNPDTAQLGTQLLLRGTPAADGVTLAMFVRRAELLELRKREFPISSLIVSERTGVAMQEVARDFQSPDIRFRSLALNTFLSDGQALVAWTSVDGGKTGSQEVVVVRLAGDRAPPVQTLRVETAGTEGTRVRDLTLVDGALLAPPVLEVFPLSSSTTTLSFRPTPGTEEESWFLETRMREVSLDTASSLLQQAFPDQTFSTVRPLVVSVRDGGSGESPPIKPAALELSAKQVARSVTLVLKRGNRGARLCVPVRLGEASGGIAGIEQMVVSDYDVDVAESSAIPNPQPQAIVDGIGFWLRPALAPSGDLALELKVKVNWRADDGRETEVRSPYFSKIDLPAFDTLWIDERLIFRAGNKELALGDATTSLVVRVD